jgi:hypothetical protein
MTKKGRAPWKNKSMPREVSARIFETRKARGWKSSREQIDAAIAARAKKWLIPNGEMLCIPR